MWTVAHAELDEQETDSGMEPGKEEGVRESIKFLI